MKGLQNFINRVLKNGVHYVTADYKTRNATYKTHEGIDLVSHKGSIKALDYIVAIDKGKVSAIGYSATGGYYVEITHDNGFISRYQHLKKGTITVKVSDKVAKGQTIAYMGNSGTFTTGAHLHFAIKNLEKKYIDPIDYLLGKKNFEKETYTIGTYETLEPMYIRFGAGTSHQIKQVKDLTVDGKKNATSTKITANAEYKKGTRFTAKEILNLKDNSIWAITPSGYICLRGSTGKAFCSKI